MCVSRVSDGGRALQRGRMWRTAIALSLAARSSHKKFLPHSRRALWLFTQGSIAVVYLDFEMIRLQVDGHALGNDYGLAADPRLLRLHHHRVETAAAQHCVWLLLFFSTEGRRALGMGDGGVRGLQSKAAMHCCTLLHCCTAAKAARPRQVFVFQFALPSARPDCLARNGFVALIRTLLASVGALVHKLRRLPAITPPRVGGRRALRGCTPPRRPEAGQSVAALSLRVSSLAGTSAA